MTGLESIAVDVPEEDIVPDKDVELEGVPDFVEESDTDPDDVGDADADAVDMELWVIDKVTEEVTEEVTEGVRLVVSDKDAVIVVVAVPVAVEVAVAALIKQINNVRACARSKTRQSIRTHQLPLLTGCR